MGLVLRLDIRGGGLDPGSTKEGSRGSEPPLSSRPVEIGGKTSSESGRTGNSLAFDRRHPSSVCICPSRSLFGDSEFRCCTRRPVRTIASDPARLTVELLESCRAAGIPSKGEPSGAILTGEGFVSLVGSEVKLDVNIVGLSASPGLSGARWSGREGSRTGTSAVLLGSVDSVLLEEKVDDEGAVSSSSSSTSTSLIGGLGGGPCMITGDLGIPFLSTGFTSTSLSIGSSASQFGSLLNTLLMLFSIRRGLGISKAGPDMTVTESRVTLVICTGGPPEPLPDWRVS